MTTKLSENDKSIVHYLRTKGSLEKDAADLIERLDRNLCIMIDAFDSMAEDRAKPKFSEDL